MGGKGSGVYDHKGQKTVSGKVYKMHIKDAYKLKRGKLTEEEVSVIFEKRADGWSQQKIADFVGVSQTTVAEYLRGPDYQRERAQQRKENHKRWYMNHKDFGKKHHKRKMYLYSIGALEELEETEEKGEPICITTLIP